MTYSPTTPSRRWALLLALVTACEAPPVADDEAPPAAARRLRPPAAGDLVPPPPTADAPPVGPEVDRAPVTMSWPIDPAKVELDPRPLPHRATSRAYWQVVTPAELAAGVPLAISEPGALLRLSARAGAGVEGVTLIDPEGAPQAEDDALVPLVSPAHLTEVGAPFPPGTVLYTLRPELGAGLFTLRAAAGADVLIYVLERESPVDLSLEPSSVIAFAGDTLALTAELRDESGALAAPSLRGEVIAPDGARSPLALARGAADAHTAALVVPRPVGPPGVLYTVQVDAAATTRAGHPVRRTVTHALAINLPTARLSGAATPERRDDGGLDLRLGVEIGAASRYGASGVLYGDHEGTMRPLAVGQTARWLDAGAGELVLSFDAAAVGGRIGGAIEVRDLRLVDQGRVQVLHRQAHALALAAGLSR